MSFFSFFYKIGEQEGRICPAWGVDTSGRVEEVRKGEFRKEFTFLKVNIVQILCTHVWKWKDDTC
jgi:hypothetical protein